MRLKITNFSIIIFFSAVMSIAHAAPKLIKVDGSSTVFPLTEAMAEEFGKTDKDIRVVVGTSGTGGGFSKFVKSEIDINNASRTIKPSEDKLVKEHGIAYLDFPVAHDGITIVVNNKNTWVDKLTVNELKKLWGPDSKVKTWKDLRPEWPNRPIKLYGPGTESGTFDFFTEAINGKSQLSRKDFTKSEDDNILVQGVSGDQDALGYFGYSYYVANQEKLKAIPVDNGKGAVEPSLKSINDESYSPLSRILYIYVSKKSLEKPEVKKFVAFYLEQAEELSKSLGFVPLSADKYKSAKERLKISNAKH